MTSLEFNGVVHGDERELRATIRTTARRCKSFLFQPICWITNSGIFEEKPRLDALELQRDELRVRVYYWRAGYRSAEAAARVEADGDNVKVAFDIVEGPATVIETLDLVQTDSVLSARRLRRARLPRPGAPLDVGEMDSTRIRIESMLWDLGYADAAVRDSVVLADTSARVTLQIEPGARTTVGSLAITGNEQVSERTIRRLVDLPAGHLFRRRDLMDAQRRLYRSDLFRQTFLEVGTSADSIKPLQLTVREAPFRAVRLRAGLNTVDFVQTEAGITWYNWHGGARRLDLRAAVGNLLAPQLYGSNMFGSAAPFGVGDEVDDAFLRPTWQVSAEVSQPWLFASTSNSISAALFANRRSVPGIVVDRGYGGSLTLTHRISERSPVSLIYRYERTRVDAGELYFCVNFGVCESTLIDALGGEHSLSPLTFVARFDQTDDPIEPTRGWTTRFEVEHASTLTASDFRYNRLAAEATYHLRMGPGVVAMHARGGWVRASSGTAEALGVPAAMGQLLHPRKRFYSGGSRSVRGFAENQLGPRVVTIDPDLLISADTSAAGCTQTSIASGDCDPNVARSETFLPRPSGGTSVIEGSLEYRLPLTARMIAALFVDAATIADAGMPGPDGRRTAVTPGIGVRYQSAIGPIRIDLGVRPTGVESLPVLTQVENADGEFELVRLDSRLSYDPNGSSHGFLPRLFSRLQLHLSIGEPF